MIRRIGKVVQGYVIEQLIGYGATAKVYRARHHLTGFRVAIKIVNKSKIIMGSPQTLTECTILSQLHHHNIVQLYSWFETEKRVFLIMELARDGDLLTRLNSATQLFPEATIKVWFTQIVDALSYIHSMNIAHKDIKPDNILLNGDRILLADWGHAHNYSPSLLNITRSGTPHYWSPEVVSNRPHLGPEVDCWSLGVLLYALVCGGLPFNLNSPSYSSDLQSGAPLPEGLSPQVKTLITGLLAFDSSKRFTIDDVKKSSFYLEGAMHVRQLADDPDGLSSSSIVSDRQRRFTSPISSKPDLLLLDGAVRPRCASTDLCVPPETDSSISLCSSAPFSLSSIEQDDLDGAQTAASIEKSSTPTQCSVRLKSSERPPEGLERRSSSRSSSSGFSPLKYVKSFLNLVRGHRK